MRTIKQRTTDIVRTAFREGLTPRTDLERAEIAVKRHEILSRAVEAMLAVVRESGDDYLALLAEEHGSALCGAVLEGFDDEIPTTTTEETS